MFYKIAFFSLCLASLLSVEHVYLSTPNLSKENIIGTNVGIRPFRKTGVRIEEEQIGGKYIIHNYGYGGSGLTLSFGGAEKVLQLLENHNSTYPIAILGAGVIGLTTAYDLLERGYEVHIYADEWSPHLTSNVAAGIWSPLTFPKEMSEEKRQFHIILEKNSERRFLKSTGDNPEFQGVKFIPAYSFKTEKHQDSETTNQQDEVVAFFDNGMIKKGKKSYELAIDGQLFMNDLFSKVKQKGAILKQLHLKSREDVLSLPETVIVNCTSLGSINLFNDQEFIPVRGQLIYLNKNIDYLYTHNIDNELGSSNHFFVMIYPWSDKMVLGGVYEIGQTEPVTTQEILDEIIQNGQQCFTGNL